MSGWEFLVPAMLFGLPLAALPVILHLLFRRKSPLIWFSTLRFVKASLQQTAARRRIQRWVLLACRMLLLALLIWAIAQPVKTLASNWLAAAKNTVAAIVIDTSYSMMLEDQQVKLLTRADETAQDLLRGVLRDSKVTVLTSATPGPGGLLQMQSATEVLARWTPLKPEAAPLPLATRVTQAMELLSRQPADSRWLIIISDLQNREFPAPLTRPQNTPMRLVLIDLHPEEPRSAGVTEVRIEPRQPIPGVGSHVAVEVAGRGGDTRAVSLGISTIQGTDAGAKPTLMANLDTTGKTQVRFELRSGLPAPTGPGNAPARFLLVNGILQADDAMAWDNTRTQLIELPPARQVTILDSPANRAVERFLRLALDPWEGRGRAWPLVVRNAAALGNTDQVAVALLDQWPDEATLQRWTGFARGGGTLMLFLKPGLERTWIALPEAQRRLLLTLLPSQPAGGPTPGSTYRAAPAATNDYVMEGLTENSLQLGQIVVRRFVPLVKPEAADVATILNLAPASPTPGARVMGLAFRRTLGRGSCFTIATLPDPLYSSLPLHPLFMPMLVRMALQSPGRGDAQNVELGQPLSLGLGDKGLASPMGIQLIDPSGAIYQFDPGRYREGEPFIWDSRELRLSYVRTLMPGLYTWRKEGDATPLAMGNVQLPAAESELVYRPAQSIAPPDADTIIARSLEQFQATMARTSEPEPRWSKWIALVLILLCVEALLGNISHLWRPIGWSALLARFGRSPAG